MPAPVLILILLLTSPAYAEDFLGVRYIRNYDGDTITVTIPYERPIFGQELGIRLEGIDTPEIRGKCENEKMLAVGAREYVRQILERATVIDLMNVSRGKYFRIVATVLVDGIDLNQALLANGMAIPYDGGTKQNPWCVAIP